jgi:tRNA1Val (adenine37-N6)-methyltransferase
MAFRFRNFEIEDSQSSMRVGTDSMLLGAWAVPPSQGAILDIGTGCGVLALMLAQKTEAQIDAIEIDLQSFQQAKYNFAASSWHYRLRAIHGDVRQFAAVNPEFYNYIISNPPFFENSLKSGNLNRNQARHDVTLGYADLFRVCRLLLTHDGAFCCIIPAGKDASVAREAHNNDFHLNRQMNIFSRADLPGRRILQEWKLTTPSAGVLQASLTLMDAQGKYSEEYLKLTREYHHF